jgi:hypothetical protein
MSLLIFVLIVIVIAAMVMWIIYYIPFPPGAPAWAKNIAYIVILLIALLVILARAGWLAGMAQAPTPVQKAPTWTAPGTWTPVVRYRIEPAPDWRRFVGATRCEQSGNVLTCDNGYRTKVQP